MPSAHLRSPLHVLWLALAVFVSAVAVAVLAAVGAPWFLGLVLGLVAATVALAWLVNGAFDRLLAAVRAQPVDDATDPRFENLVEGLSLSIGLSEPELMVVDDTALNGAAIAWADRQAIVLTTGLLAACDRIELEGLVAALLARLKSGDAEAASVASAVFGRIALNGPAAPLVRPLASWAIARWFDEQREINNDLEAVAVTRYPPGLAAALTRIAAGSHEPAGTTATTAHLWLAPPQSGDFIPHSPLPWRLDVLSET